MVEKGNTMELTENLQQLILYKSKQVQLQWYCELNCWRIPEELHNFTPEDWENLSLNEKSAFIYPFRHFILSLLGEKEVSRYWNCQHRQDSGRMTEDIFENWWAVSTKPISEVARKILQVFKQSESIEMPIEHLKALVINDPTGKPN
jgi:hypothetical protein